ncbi:MAG: hypothetical protein WBC44_02145 [Planctomycetaceae bacterium]
MASTSSDHTPSNAAYDDLSIRSIALVGGVGSVLVFVAVIAVQVVFFRYEQAEYKRKVLDVPAVKINAVLDAQRQKLNEAGAGANAERRERSIPIDEAMTIVLAEYREQRSNGEQKDQASQSENAESDLRVARESKTAADESPAGEPASEEK